MATFPVRCFTCGKMQSWKPYEKKISAGIPADNALDSLKIRRWCCRRMYLSHVPELEEIQSMYDPNSKGNHQTSVK